jgi:ribonuclease J
MHARMARNVSAGIDVVLVENGDAVLFDEHGASVHRQVPAGRVFIDGSHTGEVGDEVLRDRRHLAGDGLVVPVLAINGITGVLEETPETITRGFVVDQKTEGLLKEVPALLLSMLEQTPREERTDPGLMKERVRAELQKFFRKRANRRPLVLPVIMEV